MKRPDSHQLLSLREAYTDKNNLKRTVYILVLSSITSYFVTFILSEGLVNPNRFFNNFFKYFPAYALVIPCFGLTWGVILSAISIFFRSFLAPRLSLISSSFWRLSAVALSGFFLTFVGLIIIDRACMELFNLVMWSREWHLSVTLMGGLFGSAFAFLYYTDFEKQLLLQQAERREQDLARHQLEGELMNLNLRIRPHFFFNSLNVLASLIDKDRDQAQEFLTDLADLFRMSFTHGLEHSVARWGEEKAILTTYLTVEKMRFAGRLQWRLEVNADDADPFPAFLLQPIIENAVHHGISSSEKPGMIDIKGSHHEGHWELSVSNTLAVAAKPEIKEGHALWAIRERLKLMGGSIQLDSSQIDFVVLLNWKSKN